MIDPVANWLVRRKVQAERDHHRDRHVVLCRWRSHLRHRPHHGRPDWFLGLTALFHDVLDGTVARRTNRSSTFGAFLDSTLDRVADGAVLSGLAVFYALNPNHHNVPMMAVCLVGLIGAYMTSYIRARAEALGLDAKVGMMQRPERVVLLSAPQAFFGLALNGLGARAAIIIFLSVTAWITVVQRMHFVYQQTNTRGWASAHPAHHRKNILASSPSSYGHGPLVSKGD